MRKKTSVNIALVVTVLAMLAGFGFLVRMLPEADKVAILHAENMVCGCSDAIEKALQANKGVASVKVDVNDAKITVGYDSKKVRPEAIASSVSGLGYHSRVSQLLSIEQYRSLYGGIPGAAMRTADCAIRRSQ